jgi:diacylglycerol kinase family enzyme
VPARRPLRTVAAVVGAAGGFVAVSTAYRVRRHRRRPAEVRERREVQLDPRPDGSGVVVVVNQGAGSADGELQATLQEALPAAVVLVAEDPSGIPARLEEAAGDPATRVLGVAGGDGTLSAAAAVASDRDLPLLAIPAGPLNHLAQDLAVRSAEDAVAAVQAGSAIAVDLARIGDRTFVNTASFGSYTELVDAREALEDQIGKWPAVVVAGWRVLRRGTPVEVELDGVPTRLWMAFIGNCRYEPEGFAPSHRPRLDDGLLDIRWIDADQPLGRLRLVAGLLLGRLGRSPVYHEHTATRLVVRSTDGPLRLACDGETFDAEAEVVVEKAGEQVVLYRVAPAGSGSPGGGPG